ncbi:MAG: hypothetical protein GXP33_10605 [Spirochaetes bacterium]|nr:hypothetical protein [Spirochaetota bacterium]
MNIQEKIRAMVKHIQDKTDEEIEKIYLDAQDRSEEIKENYIDQAERRFNGIVLLAKNEADRNLRKQTARSELEAGKMITDARVDILKSAMAGIKERAENMISTGRYPIVFEQIVLEALETLDEKNAVVKTNREDREVIKTVLKSVKKKLKNTAVILSGENADIKGGIIAESEDGRFKVLNTIAEKIEENREKIAVELFDRLDKIIKTS